MFLFSFNNTLKLTTPACLGCVGIVILLISGCTAPTEAEDNLFSTLHALKTGKYETRIEERKKHLAELKQAQHEQKKELKSLEAKLAAKEKQLDYQQNALLAEKKQNALQMRYIREAKSQQTIALNQLQSLRQAIQTTDQKIHEQHIQSRGQQERLQELTRERDLLRQQLQRLINQD